MKSSERNGLFYVYRGMCLLFFPCLCDLIVYRALKVLLFFFLNPLSNLNPFFFFARHPLEKVGRECEYFTMMRHPIRSVNLSVYLFR